MIFKREGIHIGYPLLLSYDHGAAVGTGVGDGVGVLEGVSSGYLSGSGF